MHGADRLLAFVPTALWIGLAAALLSLSPTLLPWPTFWPPPPERFWLFLAVYLAGIVGALAIWLLVRWSGVRPSGLNGAIAGLAAALLIHVFSAVAVSVTFSRVDGWAFDQVQFYFIWGLLTVGWVSIPLGGAVGWLVARRWRGR